MQATAIGSCGRAKGAMAFAVALPCAFGLLCARAREARAVERQWHVGADIGLSLLDIDDKSTMDVGAGLGVDLTYGITDQFNFVAEVQSSRTTFAGTSDGASTPHTRPTGLSSAAVGVTYVFDVLRWVPYGGVLVGGDLLSGGTLDDALVLPTAQLAVGLDYQLDRTWSIGVAGRQHIFATHTSTYPSFTTVFARVEYAWGW